MSNIVALVVALTTLVAAAAAHAPLRVRRNKVLRVADLLSIAHAAEVAARGPAAKAVAVRDEHTLEVVRDTQRHGR